MRRLAKLLYQDLILAALLVPPGTAFAQTQSASASATGDQPEQVVVLGTRRADRSVTDSPVPVDVFSSDQVASEPTGDMVATLTNLVPSLNIGRNSDLDGSAFIRQPELRGLSPDETLVLFNGKRFHRSALVSLNANSLFASSQAVDLSQIPTASVDQISVLRDGAAAMYGSDAIAGVINFTLKSDRHGFTADARTGRYVDGGGGELLAEGNIGLPLGSTGYFDLSAEYRNAGKTERGLQRPLALVLEGEGYNVGQANQPNVQDFDNPGVNSIHFFYNSAVPLAEGLEIYSFGSYGHTYDHDGFNYRNPIAVNVPVPAGSGLQSFFGQSVPDLYLSTITAPDPRPGPNFGVPTTFFNKAGPTWSATSIYPNGFTPTLWGDIEDWSDVWGARGKILGQLTYDLSGTFGYNSLDYHLDNSLNSSIGPGTPTNFYIGKLVNQETDFNGDFTYPLDVGLASPLTIAFGGEYRVETYIIRQGDPASYAVGPYAVENVYDPATKTVTFQSSSPGSNGLPGYGPDSAVDSSRNSYAFYLDLEADITKDLTAGLAGRYENYSDFGGTANGEFNMRYAITPEIALRGAVSTGFMAPTPGQLFTRNVATAFQAGSGVPFEVGVLPPSDPAAAFYGATALKPEKSNNYSAGVVLTPMDGLNITLDAFHIKVYDRIGETGTINVQDSDRPALQALGVVDYATIGQVRYFTNGFSTNTQGVDLVGTYEMETGFGHFTTQLAANYTDTKVVNIQNTVTKTAGTIPLINAQSKGDIENLLPKVRGTLTEMYTLGGWTVTGRVNFYGSFTDYSTINNVVVPKTFGPQGTLDLAVAYAVTDNVTATLGGENILDSYPERETRGIYPTTGGTATGQEYPDNAPGGFNGAFVYGRVAIKVD